MTWSSPRGDTTIFEGHSVDYGRKSRCCSDRTPWVMDRSGGWSHRLSFEIFDSWLNLTTPFEPFRKLFILTRNPCQTFMQFLFLVSPFKLWKLVFASTIVRTLKDSFQKDGNYYFLVVSCLICFSWWTQTFLIQFSMKAILVFIMKPGNLKDFKRICFSILAFFCLIFSTID